MINSFDAPFKAAGMRNYDAIEAPQGGLPTHVTSFSGVMNLMGRLYSQRFDEAMRSGGTVDATAMLRDPYLLALLRERMRPTAQRRWAIKCDDMEDPFKKSVCNRVTKAIRQIPKFTMMRSSLLQALWYGRAGTTTAWAPRNIDGESWNTPVSWVPVNGDKIAFDWSMVPAIAINPMLAPSYQEQCIYTDTIPFLKLSSQQWRKQIVIHTHEVFDADYSDVAGAGAIAGTGIRGQIYWAWWLRDECLSWAINYMQKVGTLGLLIFYYDAGNPESEDAAKDAAAKASQRTVLIMPRPQAQGTNQTAGCEQISAGTAGIDSLMRIITEYFERHIERLIIGQSLSGNDGGGGLGGAGIAMLHRDTKFQILSMDSANLDESISSDLVQPIITTNIKDVDPKDYWFESILPDPSQADALNALTRIWDKVEVPLDEVYRVAGIRAPRQGEKTIGGPPPVQQQPGVGAEAPGAPTPQPTQSTPQAPGDDQAGNGDLGVDENSDGDMPGDDFDASLGDDFGKIDTSWIDKMADPRPILDQIFKGI